MQIYADVCNRPMKISRSSQTCALGSACFGAVVGGAYKTIDQASRKMTGTKPTSIVRKKRPPESMPSCTNCTTICTTRSAPKISPVV